MVNSLSSQQCLFHVAVEQHGHFTTRQAAKCGTGRDTLSYFVRRGRFRRIHRGVYRLRDYPPFIYEDVVAAWLAVGKDTAFVSHESALELHALSDVIPRTIHLTVPRSKRYHKPLEDVTIHTTTRPLTGEDVADVDGIPTTSPARTIVDAAETGTQPDQIEMAVWQALQRGITTPRRLREAAVGRNRYVRELVELALTKARP